MLWRKLLRDLWYQRWQTLPLLLVLGLGTTLFVACRVGYDSLAVSYADTQERTRLADVAVDLSRITADEVRRVGRLPGVTEVDLQTVVTLPLRIGADLRAEGRLISIPAGGNQILNHVVVEAGHYPADSGEVLVEHHFAAFHNLKAGDTLTLYAPGAERPVAVAGVAVSAEYLWVARNAFDIMPSPADFGVLFVPRPLLVEMGLSAQSGDGNRLLYNLAPGADAATVLGDIKALLGSDRVLAATARADLVGIQVLQDDIDSLSEVAVLLPVFFLTVVALILAAAMSRQVDRERPLVGTLLALGMRRRAIILHYLGYGLLTGALASGLGSMAGAATGSRFAALYARELLIPYVTVRVNPGVVATGIAMGLAASLLSCLLPALRAAMMAPAEAMRSGPGILPLRPPRRPGPHAGRPGGAPMWWRLAVRNLLRHPARSIGSMIGVAVSLLMLIGTAGMADSTSRWLDLAMSAAPRYDLRADFAIPMPAAELEATVRRIDGVQSMQSLLCLPVQLRHGDRLEQSVALILPRDGPMLRVLTTGGAELIAGDGQVLVNEAMARRLELRAGDEVDIRQMPGGRTIRRTAAALSGTMMSEPVVFHGSEAAADFGLSGGATTVLVRVDGAKTRGVAAALRTLPAVVRVSELAQVRAQIAEMMGLIYLIIAIMFGCGAVLAGCILFSTATLNVVERQRELATMRANGHTMGGLAWLITVENLLTASLGAAIGLPLGVYVLRQVVGLYESTLFSLPYVVKPQTLALALVTVLAVMLLAQAPALRHVARLNLAEATRTRE